MVHCVFVPYSFKALSCWRRTEERRREYKRERERITVRWSTSEGGVRLSIATHIYWKFFFLKRLIHELFSSTRANCGFKI